MTQRALIAYSVGLLGIIVIKVLAPGFYAQQNIRTPVKIAIFTLVCTQLFNLVLIGPLAHAGLALAISAGACLNAGLLFYQLRKQQMYQPQPGWGMFGFKLVVAVAVMSACCCWACISCRPGIRAYAGALPAPGGAGGGWCGGVFRDVAAARFPLRDFQSQGVGLRFAFKTGGPAFCRLDTLVTLLPVVDRRVWL
jgi:hypothetical protein